MSDGISSFSKACLTLFLCAGCPTWTSKGPVDSDGDGYLADEDCDDEDASAWAGSEVRDGDVDLESSAEVRAFCAGFCEVALTGNLTVGPSVSSLDKLSCLRSVAGDLRITNNDALESLSGLDALSSIGGDLYLLYDGTLTSLEGLEALTTIGGDLHISHMDQVSEEEFYYVRNNDKKNTDLGTSIRNEIIDRKGWSRSKETWNFIFWRGPSHRDATRTYVGA